MYRFGEHAKAQACNPSRNIKVRGMKQAKRVEASAALYMLFNVEVTGLPLAAGPRDRRERC